MSAPNLRLSPIDDPAVSALASHQPPRVSVRAAEVLPLLLHAAECNRAWVEDFAEDGVEISRDLYEVLLAYKRISGELGTSCRAA